MTHDELILTLTKNHFNKKIKYYIFDSSHAKTDTMVEKKVSEIFTEQEWNHGIKMLDKLQQTAQSKGELSFTCFWENFFIGVKSDIDARIKHAKASALNVEQYLKFILVLLGHSKDVDSIQSSGGSASMVLGIAQKAGLFSSRPEEAPHIFDTIRCYANWWRHGSTKTVNNNLEELRHTMIALPLTNEQDDDFIAADNRVLSEHIRLILVALLIIIGSTKEIL
jgi:hypothetical protein